MKNLLIRPLENFPSEVESPSSGSKNDTSQLTLVHNAINVESEQQSEAETKQIAQSAKNDLNYPPTKSLTNIVTSCPALLRDIVLKFSSSEEQVMALYSAIVLTGSLMPYVNINYDNKTNYPALMLLAVFPPASGKGGVSLIRILGNKINAELIDQHRLLMANYQQKNALYERSLKTGTPLLPPEKPKLLSYLVPGNITSAKLAEQLSHNGSGQFLTIFETEADAFGISTSNSQHGGHLSSMLRSAYQFEQISQSRKQDSELLIADKPKLAMVLTGTENQISKIFPSNADGLYSRFLIIRGDSPAQWKNVKPNPNNRPLNEYFEDLANEYHKLWKYFQNNHTEVKFSDNQWRRINSFGEQNLAVTHHFTGQLTGSIAKRHANMITRLAAILMMMRYYERQDVATEVICTNDDFETALWMAKCSIHWSLQLYRKLPGKKDDGVSQQNLKIFESLPDTFYLKDFTKYYPGWKKSTRTLNRLMDEFVTGRLLTREGHGQYKKTSMSQLALSQIKSNNNA